MADISLRISGENIRYRVESRDKTCNRKDDCLNGLICILSCCCAFELVLSSGFLLCRAGVQLCGEFLPCDLCGPVFVTLLDCLLALKMFYQFLRIFLHIFIGHYGGLIENGTHRVWHY